MPKYNTTYDVELITDKPVDELDAALAQFPSNTLIFALSNTLPKSDGSMYSPAETARYSLLLHRFPSIPIGIPISAMVQLGGKLLPDTAKGKRQRSWHFRF